MYLCGRKIPKEILTAAAFSGNYYPGYYHSPADILIMYVVATNLAEREFGYGK